MKKGLKSIVAIGCIAMAVSGCNSSKNAMQPAALQGEWNILEVEGMKAEAERSPFLGLNIKEKAFYGCAGCNRIMGEIVADEKKPGRLSFEHVSASRMLCSNMQTETAVLKALNETSGYTGTETSLVFTNEQGDTLMILTKVPETTLEKLDGTWNITHVNDMALTQIGETEKQPFLTFHANNKTVGGYAGCNNINGEILQEDGQPTSMKFDKMIATMMSGPGLEVEVKILEAINNVAGFKIKGEKTAVLLDANEQEIITLKKD